MSVDYIVTTVNFICENTINNKFCPFSMFKGVKFRLVEPPWSRWRWYQLAKMTAPKTLVK